MTMMLWGFIVAGLQVIGAVPLFAGLGVVMPVLGHATWHLYRKGCPALTSHDCGVSSVSRPC
jgi:uncharacterized membrane protein